MARRSIDNPVGELVQMAQSNFDGAAELAAPVAEEVEEVVADQLAEGPHSCGGRSIGGGEEDGRCIRGGRRGS